MMALHLILGNQGLNKWSIRMFWWETGDREYMAGQLEAFEQ
jgi:hypothetical protein